jgi:hypothetical protein
MKRLRRISSSDSYKDSLRKITRVRKRKKSSNRERGKRIHGVRAKRRQLGEKKEAEQDG